MTLGTYVADSAKALTGELPAGESGLLYSIGFVMATGCLHGVGISIGLIHRWSWGQRAVRVAGAAIALAGILFMWKVFA